MAAGEIEIALGVPTGIRIPERGWSVPSTPQAHGSNAPPPASETGSATHLGYGVDAQKSNRLDERRCAPRWVSKTSAIDTSTQTIEADSRVDNDRWDSE